MLGIFWLMFIALAGNGFLFKPYQVPSDSMEPAIRENDRIVVDRLVYHFLPIRRGDVIVFASPASVGTGTPLVKRVIGLPGDTVEIRDGQVLVNNHPFIVAGATSPTYTLRKVIVPPGQLFVLGDNRDYSYDSHVMRFGDVPKDNVIGRVEVVYWPPSHIRSCMD